MSCEVSETLEKLAAEHQCATTQKERDRVWQEIIRVSYRQESDREREWRRTRQGEFESSMPSLDAQAEKFDDPGKIAAFSDGGAGAARVRGAASRDPTEVDAALAALPDRDRAIAWAVLSGCGWRETGIPKATFYRRLKKVESRVRLPPSKTSLKT